MQFQSTEFLFFFLPVFLAVYYIAPRSWRSGVLLAGSLLFYAMSCSGQYWQVAVAVCLTVITYAAGQALSGGKRRWFLGLCLIFFTGLLAFFKLWNGGSCLPGGMSFYLFYMAAWLVEVSRQKLEPGKGIVEFGAKTLMFPRLLSGPISDPVKLSRQNGHLVRPWKHLYGGLQKLILGLSIKVMVADRLAGLWADVGVTGFESISTPLAWLALIAYALRLYLDFWGYSMMAVGLGQMLGFRLPRNFDNPYASKTVSEFYRRWHITLGAWFRDYIYIPLGGNRKGMIRTIVNLAVIWLLTGLWHGIGVGYLLWAGFLLLLIINEKLWLGKLLNRTRILGHCYTVFVILLSWLPFAIGNWDQMVMYAGRLFGLLGNALNEQDFLVRGGPYWWYLAAGVILATPLPEKLWKKIRGTGWADAILFVLFWAAVYCIATAEQSPFLYFQF